MYKKLTCAFCLVISCFIIAVVVYLLLTETDLFSEKPPEIKVPTISIYLFNATTRRDQVLHNTSDSDYVLDFENLKLTDSSEGDHGANFYKPWRKNILRIQCHSNYPVQLKYIGYGNVTNARNFNRRQIEDFNDRSTYTYFTELEFDTVDEGITGRYDCQVRDENVLKASTFVYLYAAGSKSFVSQFTHELVVEPKVYIEIPCPVTHPNKSVTLLSIMRLTQGIMERETEPDTITRHDPKVGYILRPNSWGSYQCKNEKTSELSGLVTVFMPLNKVVKGRILRISSQKVNNTDNSLKVGCRATEAVELRFINFIKFNKIQREMKKDPDYPHGVSIKLETEWFRGNTSIVECVTKRNQRVVKTWKFLNQELHEDYNYSNPQLILSHNKQNGYQCCTDRNDVRPTLTTYPCNTTTECELRSPCLSYNMRTRNRTTTNCPLFDVANEALYEGDKGCTLLKVKGNRSGTIRCSLDGTMKDYTYFTGMNMEGTYSSLTMGTSNKKKIDPQTILKISQNTTRASTSTGVQKGAIIRFDCMGSKLHLSSGFQWGLQRNDEQIKYFINKGSRIETDSSVHHEWIDFPFTDHDKKRFYCFAPFVNPTLLHGQQWINVSIAFR